MFMTFMKSIDAKFDQMERLNAAQLLDDLVWTVKKSNNGQIVPFDSHCTEENGVVTIYRGQLDPRYRFPGLGRRILVFQTNNKEGYEKFNITEG